ncbi:ESX secretion-associated protein EspG [Nocardia speluncae]|uniref:ESX secretion-associated protein EspG n=1 Tax=Nocardia speluncae TaxID=419477 RepID=A0A846XAU4_9NOCA|nr:ESX secretion-associated protein EspG [Nocardia speluncae]NKY31766.1 ESX secretion-associated protein EspG [Nocardia speluncae]
MRSLSNDALLLAAERLGVQTLPRVLAAGPQQDSYTAWAAARDQALIALQADGVLDDHGEVDSELASALFTLAHPERELVARIYPGTTVTRVSIAQSAGHHAVATRIGDRYEIGLLWSDGTPDALATPLLTALGACDPADVPAFSASAGELAARLSAAEDTSGYVDALHALGLRGRDATQLGSALGSCHGFAEIVAYAHTDGVTVRAPGTVAVYDTRRGRIVSAPMVSPDQQVWTTLTAGSDHRVTQALAALFEGLPGGRWLTSSHGA